MTPDLTHWGNGKNWVSGPSGWVHVRVWMHELWEREVSWRVGSRWV